MTEEQKNALDTWFNGNYQIYCLARSICEEAQKRADKGEAIEKALNKEFDEQILYYEQQWNILHFYCTPKDADYMTAEQNFFDDLLAILTE